MLPATKQRGTLVVVCVATAMLMLDIAVVNMAPPCTARDLHAGLTGVQWVVDAYTLALAAVVLTAGSVADRRGRRLVFATGMVVFTAASLACGVSQSIALLDASRAAQVAALMFASSLAILADAFPAPRQLAGAMAAYGATIGASFAIGPAVGGALTSGVSWLAVFLINVPLGLPALLGIELLRGNVDGWRASRRSPSYRRRPSFWPRSDDRAPHARADAPARASRQARLQRGSDRRVRDLVDLLRAVPVHDAVPPERAPAVGTRRRTRRCAGCVVRSLCRPPVRSCWPASVRRRS
jgi:MFS family permease